MSCGINDLKLTKTQEECVNFGGRDLLVKGIAGSGKSLVLMKRALKLGEEAMKKNQKINIGFFTYTNALIGSIEETFVATKKDISFMKVTTFDAYAYKVIKGLGFKKRILGGKKDKKIVHELISKAINKSVKKYGNSRLYKLNFDFWEKEIKWIKGKRLSTFYDYEKTPRHGRGSAIRVTKDDKKIIFDVYQEYYKLVFDKGCIEFSDLASIILANLNRLGEREKFDYIMVDEAQDLSYAQLLLLKKIARIGIVIAADHAQKIYNNSFTWNELGIKVRGKSSKKLIRNFRSTKQIVLLANSLISHNDAGEGTDEEYIESEIPELDGEKPRLFMCDSDAHEDEIIVQLLEAIAKNKEKTIGLFYRTMRQLEELRKLLKKRNISYTLIKGKRREENLIKWSILEPGVKLVSMHSAKGLEFDTVLIPKVNEKILPIESDDGDIEQELQIERSLLFVSMTRAKSELYITCSINKSRFIDELDESLLRKITY